jgi:hypothetical protein
MRFLPATGRPQPGHSHHRPTPPLGGVYPFEGKAGNGPAEREEHAMAEFIFTYRTPADYTLGTPDGIAAWNAWFRGMGSQVRDVGKPVFNRATVGDGADGALLGGYSLVTADNLDEALTLAKGCPIVAVGGGVEVGGFAEMPG